MLMQEAADQLVGAALDDLDDGAFGLAAILAARLDQHAVAMQHLEHFARRQEQVRAAVVTQQEAETVAVAQHLAGHEVQLGGSSSTPLRLGIS